MGQIILAVGLGIIKLRVFPLSDDKWYEKDASHSQLDFVACLCLLRKPKGYGVNSRNFF